MLKRSKNGVDIRVKIKPASIETYGFYVGTPSQVRTVDTLIKSQVLYQLS